jgi:hypothetical protein
VAERTAAEIRAEIAAERVALRQDVDALKRTLRSRVPLLLAAVLAVALAAVGLVMGISRLRKRG